MVDAPGPVEAALDQLVVERKMLGRIEQPVRLVEDRRALRGERFDLDAERVIEKGRTLVLGPHLVHAIGRHVDLGSDLGGIFALVGHRVPQTAAPDAAKDHVLV